MSLKRKILTGVQSITSTSNIFQKRTVYSDRGKDAVSKYLQHRLKTLPPTKPEFSAQIDSALEHLYPKYNKELVDLRSDTQTIPDVPMLKAMVSSLVGDDLNGEDPTTQELEQ
eukprot:Sdes_comp9810_c0_seq1m1344